MTTGYRRHVSSPDQQEPTDTTPVRSLRVRRSPRYGAFLATGAVLGLVVALVAGSVGPVDPQTGRAKLLGYLAMTLVLLGGLAGVGVAVALERFAPRSRFGSSSRARRRG